MSKLALVSQAYMKAEDKRWVEGIYNTLTSNNSEEEKQKSLTAFLAFPPSPDTRAVIINYDGYKVFHYSCVSSEGDKIREKIEVHESKD